MATDPWAIDNAAGLPSYSGAELRLNTVTPHFVGAGASLGVYSGVRLSGSGTDLLVQAQSSPNMTVKVNAGVFVGQGAISSAQGAYSWCLDTLTNLTISAAHATLSRTDLIVVRIRDANVDTSGQRDGSVVVVTGTAGSGTPALPTDASYFTIAQITVPAAVTTIGGGGGGTIADKRTFCAALGGVLPFVSTARPTSCMDGQPGWETDTGLRYTYRTSVSKWLRDSTDLLKTTDLSWTSNTNPSNTIDSDIAFTGEANATYAFDLSLSWIGNTTALIKYGFSFPSGRLDYGRTGKDSAGGLFADYVQNAATLSFAQSGSTSISAYGTSRLTGIWAAGVTGGTFGLVSGQVNSNASASWVLRGTQMRYRQIS